MGMVHQEMFTQKNRMKIDADDDKRASMTMIEGEGSSHTTLYSISHGFAEICGVRAETYVEIKEYIPKHM